MDIRKIRWLLLLLFLCLPFSAKASDPVEKTEEKPAEETTTELPDITPTEPSSSDLKIVHTVTKLSAKRWMQSFTFDSKYYYYLSMTNPYKGHLRVTRVKYRGIGKYTRDYMDLRYFSHGTTLDSSTSGGVTWLWTGGDCAKGSDVSRSVTAFRFVKGQKLYHHGPVSYRIRKGTKGKYVTNVYPAVSRNNKKLIVRFTYKKKQYYQFYDLRKGTIINTDALKRQLVLAPTRGDFQGFDMGKDSLYTIEGSPRKSFLETFNGGTRIFEPTVVRTYNLKKNTKKKQVIYGARKLTFREPEGIRITRKGKKYMLYVSHLLDNQSANIYQIK